MFMSLRLAPLLKAMPFALRPKPALTMQASSGFSEFFEKQDTKDLTDLIMNKHRKDFLHYKLTDQWKKPLERKARRKVRKEEIAAAKVEPAPQQEKLVVHNQALGIEYPPKIHEQFAIIQVDGFQYKVLEDTMLILDTKPEHEINKVITFDKIPLLGTRTYTLLGRPLVGCAHVEAIVESISNSHKVIVFKKKRRKQYKKSFGFRTSLTQCRITRIVHHLNDGLLNTAIAL